MVCFFTIATMLKNLRISVLYLPCRAVLTHRRINVRLHPGFATIPSPLQAKTTPIFLTRIKRSVHWHLALHWDPTAIESQTNISDTNFLHTLGYLNIASLIRIASNVP